MESRQRNAAREISPSLLAARQGIKMDDRLGNMYYLTEKRISNWYLYILAITIIYLGFLNPPERTNS